MAQSTKVSFIITGERNISLVVKGTPFYVLKGADNYELVLKALKDGLTEDQIFDIVNVEKAVKDYLTASGITVKDGVVLYNGEELHNVVTNRIMDFMRDGLPYKPLVNFLARLMKNPSYSARQETFDFLSHKALPITEDGCFLAYKAITAGYKDKWTQTFDNGIGKAVAQARHLCDDDRTHACAPGLHCGTIEYVLDYGRFSKDPTTSDRAIIVKVDPMNVVAVPADSSCQKMRTCGYTVVKEYSKALLDSLYSIKGDSLTRTEGQPEAEEVIADDPCEGCQEDCEGCEHFN